MIDSTLRSRVANVVEKHLPTTSRRLPDGLDEGIERFSEFWAENILDASVYETDGFGVSHDVETLQGLIRATRDVQRFAKALSPSATRAIDRESALSAIYEEPKSLVKFGIFYATMLERAVSEVTKRRAFRTPAGKKQNWRAVSMARECRRIWAVEASAANNGPPPSNALVELGLSGEELERARAARARYENHLRDYAPRTAHHDRPGPFGLFLEDVFSAVEVFSRTGGPVAAATALDALGRLERKEKLRKNLSSPNQSGV